MSIRLNGSTSGYVEIDAPAVAGSTSITLPATSGGEVVVTDSSGDLNVDNGTFFVDSSADRVGIGTMSPDTALTVSDSSATGYKALQVIATGTASDAGIRLEGFNSTAFRLQQPAGTGGLIFYDEAGGATRMSIASNGAVGFASGITLGSVTPTAGGFYSTAAVLGTGAGTNAVKFSTTTGRITYDTSSRLNKTDIEDCPYGIAEVKQLLPRRYYRTDDERLEVGFVADEVASVLPEFVPFGPKSAVTGNEEDTEVIPVNVNYDKLTAVLTKALQEALAKIETLETANASFEARLTALEGGQP